jgi:hypothetical protein
MRLMGMKEREASAIVRSALTRSIRRRGKRRDEPSITKKKLKLVRTSNRAPLE